MSESDDLLVPLFVQLQLNIVYNMLLPFLLLVDDSDISNFCLAMLLFPFFHNSSFRILYTFFGLMYKKNCL